MNKLILCIITIITFSSAFAQWPSPQEVVEKVNGNFSLLNGELYNLDNQKTPGVHLAAVGEDCVDGICLRILSNSSSNISRVDYKIAFYAAKWPRDHRCVLQLLDADKFLLKSIDLGYFVKTFTGDKVGFFEMGNDVINSVKYYTLKAYEKE